MTLPFFIFHANILFLRLQNPSPHIPTLTRIEIASTRL
ncbi:MAG: hypothetical protein ACI8PB_000233 [Desulforhopalus sp.]|jgi:hypothetical protein